MKFDNGFKIKGYLPGVAVLSAAAVVAPSAGAAVVASAGASAAVVASSSQRHGTARTRRASRGRSWNFMAEDYCFCNTCFHYPPCFYMCKAQSDLHQAVGKSINSLTGMTSAGSSREILAGGSLIDSVYIL